MTKNQIAYLNYLESVRNNRTMERIRQSELAETTRHNIAYEGETNRHNVVYEQETNRHNVAGEWLNQQSLNETIRHNKSYEGYLFSSLAESSRHNQAVESQALAELNEQHRHSLAVETETARANKVKEMHEGRSLQLRKQEIDLKDQYNHLYHSIATMEEEGRNYRHTQDLGYNYYRTNWDAANNTSKTLMGLAAAGYLGG